MDFKTNKRQRGEVELTSEEALIQALDAAISSQHTAELAVLHLLKNYGFDLDELRRLLQGLFSS